MKKHLKILLAAQVIIGSAFGQVVKESICPLSKAAQKGFLDEASVGKDGSIKMVYQMKGGGKDEILYEEYKFDQDLKLVENKPVSEKKEMKPDKEVERMGAWIGGCTSFDILSMKLRISRDKVNMEWNYKKQRYEKGKTLKSETVKLKNEKGNPYYGVEEFYDEDNDKAVIFVYTETKDKATPRRYAIVRFGTNGDPEEYPVDLTGSYTIASTDFTYDQTTGAGRMVVILAPDKGDQTKYVLLAFDEHGIGLTNTTFTSPSPAMLVNVVMMDKGAFYVFGTSKKGKDAFGEEYTDYVPMSNPCFKDGPNYQMTKFWDKVNTDMDNMHFVKVEDGKETFATTTPIASIKSKMKTPPSQKGGSPYKGEKFSLNEILMTPSGDYLMIGQLTGYGLKMGGKYKDLLCLQFDAKGEFKTQYAVDRVNDDSKSEIFKLNQNLYLSPDGKSVYWEVMEAKGVKGYNGFWDAYNDRPTYYAREYPRIAKIDLTNGSISDFQMLGQKKYFVNRLVRDLDSGVLTYIGRNESESDIWLARITLQ